MYVFVLQKGDLVCVLCLVEREIALRGNWDFL